MQGIWLGGRDRAVLELLGPDAVLRQAERGVAGPSERHDQRYERDDERRAWPADVAVPMRGAPPSRSCARPGALSNVERIRRPGGRSTPGDPYTYAYSDAASDLPMLRLVDHPVVVNPDPELAVALAGAAVAGGECGAGGAGTAEPARLAHPFPPAELSPAFLQLTRGTGSGADRERPAPETQLVYRAISGARLPSGRSWRPFPA